MGAHPRFCNSSRNMRQTQGLGLTRLPSLSLLVRRALQGGKKQPLSLSPFVTVCHRRVSSPRPLVAELVTDVGVGLGCLVGLLGGLANLVGLPTWWASTWRACCQLDGVVNLQLDWVANWWASQLGGLANLVRLPTWRACQLDGVVNLVGLPTWRACQLDGGCQLTT